MPRHIYLSVAQQNNILGADGKPLDSSELNDSGEETLEKRFAKSKTDILKANFKANQVSIIEQLQAKLMRALETDASPNDLIMLVEAIRSSQKILEDADELYDTEEY